MYLLLASWIICAFLSANVNLEAFQSLGFCDEAVSSELVP
jgi:hypothetical protein